MINQQVNLYQDRFREKKLWVSAGQVTAVIICLLFIAGTWSYLLESSLEESQQFNLQIKRSQEQVANELAALNAELARLLEDKSLDNKVNSLTREINARRRVIKFVEANRFGSGEGFSSYLTALSNLHMQNVWLDEISLAENFIRIKGSALGAELVPDYFSRFSEQAIFQGNRFDLFELSRLESTDWKVDFEIATSLVANE